MVWSQNNHFTAINYRSPSTRFSTRFSHLIHSYGVYAYVNTAAADALTADALTTANALTTAASAKSHRFNT
ncbi:hypothetical protein GJ744_006893 [Endocarpon pusillum]|uniref:Uncharacterized protein n=1 Tax=Endocarpon pusillum TaxID=364733 RepID=A0A8H7ALF6_9EURO|nr:hypothetical protein GJ744_006893 [Endocarpon pusillum]